MGMKKAGAAGIEKCSKSSVRDLVKIGIGRIRSEQKVFNPVSDCLWVGLAHNLSKIVRNKLYNSSDRNLANNTWQGIPFQTHNQPHIV